MNTKRLSDRALTVIDQYLNFHIGKIGTTLVGTNQPGQVGLSEAKGVTCSIPYYNNRRNNLQGGLRALTGKGSPKDIFDEVEIIMLKEKVPVSGLTDETFKWFLVDHKIGVDCSGFAYYILNAEGNAREKNDIDHYLSFPFRTGLLGKLRSKLRPVGNTDVATFAHDDNSIPVALKDAQVGDMIVMIDAEKSRDHILVIHQIDYQNFVPITIFYSHSIAWPTDGQYNHGVRQGQIEVLDANKSIAEQVWSENGITGAGDAVKGENYTLTRALKAKTEIRRLKWL